METDINKVELVGVLPRDAMYKQVGANGTPLVSFTVMTARKWIDPATTEPKQSVQYNNVSAWRVLAETNAPKLKMGTRVKVVGELTSRSWDDPQKGKQYKTEVVANVIEILGESEIPVSSSAAQKPANETINASDLPF
jgi:single-strand DNA-binding protein